MHSPVLAASGLSDFKYSRHPILSSFMLHVHQDSTVVVSTSLPSSPKLFRLALYTLHSRGTLSASPTVPKSQKTRLNILRTSRTKTFDVVTSSGSLASTSLFTPTTVSSAINSALVTSLTVPKFQKTRPNNYILKCQHYLDCRANVHVVDNIPKAGFTKHLSSSESMPSCTQQTQ